MPKRYGTIGPRAIYPSACTSLSLAKCDPMAQLLFDRMLTQADDQGRLVGDPNVVKSLCVPMVHAATVRKITKWLGELEAAEMVRCYEADGVALIQFTNWWEYQAGMKRSYPSRYPAPRGWTDRVRAWGPRRTHPRGTAGADRGKPGGEVPPPGPASPEVQGEEVPPPRARILPLPLPLPMPLPW